MCKYPNVRWVRRLSNSQSKLKEILKPKRYKVIIKVSPERDSVGAYYRTDTIANQSSPGLAIFKMADSGEDPGTSRPTPFKSSIFTGP